MDSLATYVLERGPLETDHAVGWTLRLIVSLRELHERGQVHGRISDEAILGASPDPAGDGWLIHPADLENRPAFQSPQRLAGGGATPEDDSWGVAVLLYCCLTGELPFGDGAAPEVLDRYLLGPPPPLAVFDVGSDDLQMLLDKLLAAEGRMSLHTVGANLGNEVLGGVSLPPLKPCEPAEDEELEPTAIFHTEQAPRLSAVLTQARREAAAAEDPAAEAPDDAPGRSDAAPSHAESARADAPRPAPRPPPPRRKPPPAGRKPRRQQKPPERKPPSAQARPLPPKRETSLGGKRAPNPGGRDSLPSATEETLVSAARPGLSSSPESADEGHEAIVTKRLVLFISLACLAAGAAIAFFLFDDPFRALIPRKPSQASTAVRESEQPAPRSQRAPAPADTAEPASIASPPVEATSAAPSPTPSANDSSTESVRPPPSEPSDDLITCVRPLYPADTFVRRKPSLDFLCDTEDAVAGAGALRTQVVVSGGRGGVTEGMREWSALGWYGMAAFAITRARCCPAAAPVTVPEARERCGVDERLSELAGAMHREDEATTERTLDGYEKAVLCAFRSGSAATFGRRSPPTRTGKAVFGRILQRALSLER